MSTDDEVILRQSKVTLEGNRVENEIIQILKGNKFINKHTIIGQGPSRKKKGNSYKLCDKKEIEISDLLIKDYKGGVFLIDADIVVYHKDKREILCVISSKKSFRERGAQTAYWANKLQEKGVNFKYVLATPDVDNELYKPEHPKKINKWRAILSHEMDAVFVINSPDEEGDKIKVNITKTLNKMRIFLWVMNI